MRSVRMRKRRRRGSDMNAIWPRRQIDQRRSTFGGAAVSFEGGHDVVDRRRWREVKHDRAERIFARRNLNPESIIVAMDADDLCDPTARAGANSPLVQGCEPLIGGCVIHGIPASHRSRDETHGWSSVRFHDGCQVTEIRRASCSKQFNANHLSRDEPSKLPGTRAENSAALYRGEATIGRSLLE